MAAVPALLGRLERLVLEGREAAGRATAMLALPDDARRRVVGAAWPSRFAPRRGGPGGVHPSLMPPSPQTREDSRVQQPPGSAGGAGSRAP
jgi:hypothetical protein